MNLRHPRPPLDKYLRGAFPRLVTGGDQCAILWPLRLPIMSRFCESDHLQGVSVYIRILLEDRAKTGHDRRNLSLVGDS